jgi:hypothetical protein
MTITLTLTEDDAPTVVVTHDADTPSLFADLLHDYQYDSTGRSFEWTTQPFHPDLELGLLALIHECNHAIAANRPNLKDYLRSTWRLATDCEINEWGRPLEGPKGQTNYREPVYKCKRCELPAGKGLLFSCWRCWWLAMTPRKD